MTVDEVFIFELCTVDALSAGSIPLGKIPSLAHKAGNDAMEDTSFVVEWLSRPSIAFVAHTK